MSAPTESVQRRQQILVALFQVIHARGIDGVTMRAVARAADVSVGAIQHHFGSRTELIVEGCRTIIGAADQAHQQRTSAADPLATVRSIICAPIPTTEQFRVGITVWFAYLAKINSHPEIRQLLSETAAATQRETARLLTLAQVADAEQSAARLLALSEGLAQRVLIGAVDATVALDLLDAELAGLPLKEAS